jgi:hypothetical protein
MATRNVPGVYRTISVAVAAATTGDSVLVASRCAGNEGVTVEKLTSAARASQR